MEYEINSFVAKLRELMYDKFPNLPDRGRNPNGSYKHKYYNQEIRDVAFKNNPTVYVDDNTLMFDIGNPFAEEHYPYYHILEDAPVIRKSGRGTEKTKGSQAKVDVKGGKRDYGRVDFNGKTFTKEYSRNVRGERNKVVQNAQRHLYVNGKMQPVMIHRGSNSYKNEHYQYIENMLNGGIIDQIAAEFGLRPMRTQDKGLGQEYIMQEYGILNILGSFE